MPDQLTKHDISIVIVVFDHVWTLDSLINIFELYIKTYRGLRKWVNNQRILEIIQKQSEFEKGNKIP